MSLKGKKVFIVQRVVPSYRSAFYDGLYKRLAEFGVELKLAAGQPWPEEAFEDARMDLDFVHGCKNIRIFKKAYWEIGAYSSTRNADLVIFEQANSALINYLFILRRWVAGKKPLVAYWGHGAYLNKTKANELRDIWKRFWLNKVDHWFAYTSLSHNLVLHGGFDAERITTVQNAIDTHGLREAAQGISLEMRGVLFEEIFGHKRDPSVKVGVYCARLTLLKDIPFLLRAVEQIKHKIPDFHFIIIGDGPEQDRVQSFVEHHDWCRWVGARHGKERVNYLIQGDVWLNPGMTGLSILDSFALGIPFVTRDSGIHSPEISYLRSGMNGLLTKPNEESFIDAVVQLLESPKLSEFAKEAYKDGAVYTIETMVENYAQGIVKALDI